jgi:hypothetical protein
MGQQQYATLQRKATSSCGHKKELGSISGMKISYARIGLLSKADINCNDMSIMV